MTQRAYVKNWGEQREEGATKVVMNFEFSPQLARVWGTHEEAESRCRELESYNIKIPERGDMPCKHFAVEERAAGQFVIACEYPLP